MDETERFFKLEGKVDNLVEDTQEIKESIKEITKLLSDRIEKCNAKFFSNHAGYILLSGFVGMSFFIFRGTI